MNYTQIREKAKLAAQKISEVNAIIHELYNAGTEVASEVADNILDLELNSVDDRETVTANNRDVLKYVMQLITEYEEEL